ncbi:MAG: replication-associated recombination protein A [Candidatus Marinimicrobia bacterium]|nr:replication-associated recombination protein A [Candidatus Neomarinimicrobiota bacterium]
MENANLFEQKNETLPPLAVRMRPSNLEEHLGQEHLTGPENFIRSAWESGRLFSIILWGPPGSGKTSLARLLSSRENSRYYELSAVTATVKDVREIIQKGKNHLSMGQQAVLFLDEIHRFNKAQQDALLPAVESGNIVLIGATTENPSFNVISPLLSRSRVLRLKALDESALRKIFVRSLKEDILLSKYEINISEEDKNYLFSNSGGDARKMLNTVDIAFNMLIGHNPVANTIEITKNVLNTALQEKNLLYDRAGDYHYDSISAYIKSMRGSDCDAAIYWLAVMLEGGEDPVFIARRLIILASEDIGNAEPFALTMAVSTMQAVQVIGMPEAMIPLAQATTYMAAAPKSNASYTAIKGARTYVRETGVQTIPLHLRNAPTELMKKENYGLGYRYPHDEGGFSKQNYLPENVEMPIPWYKPKANGYEKFISERLKKLWPERFEKEQGTR